MSRSTPPPGTADITPEEVGVWLELESQARSTFSLYGFGEIRTPIFEYTEVFERGLGDQTEVVQKEMYTFLDRGGRSLTLRPEGTAGVMRSLSGTEALNGVEQRVFYIGPMFRGERPAAGRRRQFHQIGVENAGRIHPRLDAESITMLVHFLKNVGINDAKLLINTRGDAQDREIGAQLLKNYFASKLNDLCEDCKQRFQKNIWRILDCKQPQCQAHIEAAPNVTDAFTAESKAYFSEVCRMLDQNGITYIIEPRLVRGLDYYVHTVFELTHHGLGAQSAIAGGGRYSLQIGTGKPIIGVGFAAGMERLIMVREALGLSNKINASPKSVFLISLGEKGEQFNHQLVHTLRQNQIPAMIEPESGKSMKSQMRTANRLESQWVIVTGDREVDEGFVVLKNMQDGTQEEIKSSELISILNIRIK